MPTSPPPIPPTSGAAAPGTLPLANLGVLLNYIKSQFQGTVLDSAAVRSILAGTPLTIQKSPELYEILRQILIQAGVQADTTPEVDQSQSYATVATETTLPNSRKLAAGANITLTDGGPQGNLTIAASGGGGSYPPIDITTSYVYEDFSGGNDGMNTGATALDVARRGFQGNTGFTVITHPLPPNDQSAFFDSYETDTPDHPGVLLIQLPGSFSQYEIGLVAPYGTNSGQFPGFDASKQWSARFVFKCNVDVYNSHDEQKVGFAFTTNTGFGSIAGVYLIHSPLVTTTANWTAAYYKSAGGGGIQSQLDTGVSFTNDQWLFFQMDHAASATTVQISLNGTSIGNLSFDPLTIDGTWPTMGPMFALYRNENPVTVQTMSCDFYDCLISGLTRY